MTESLDAQTAKLKNMEFKNKFGEGGSMDNCQHRHTGSGKDRARESRNNKENLLSYLQQKSMKDMNSTTNKQQ